MNVEPLVVLVIAPALVGLAAELAFRDARRASLAAALGAVTIACVAVQWLDESASWDWLAALLVSPLPIAIAVATALFAYGHAQARQRHRRRDA